MRFYVLPADEGKTVCVNFDHVTNIAVGPQTIELFLLGQEAPMVLKKTVNTLSTIGKGMDPINEGSHVSCKQAGVDGSGVHIPWDANRCTGDDRLQPC